MVVIDEAGNISPPIEFQDQTTAILPAAVSDLSGNALDTDQIKVTFTAPADDPGADWPPEHERGVQNFDIRYSAGSLTSRI